VPARVQCQNVIPYTTGIAITLYVKTDDFAMKYSVCAILTNSHSHKTTETYKMLSRTQHS